MVRYFITNHGASPRRRWPPWRSTSSCSTCSSQLRGTSTFALDDDEEEATEMALREEEFEL
jgi:hypothetical protein